MKIDELAKQVVDEIVKLIKQKKITLKEIEGILKNYSDEVKKIIEEELKNNLGEFYYTNTNPEIVVTPPLLSEMLYKNAKNTAKDVYRIIQQGMKANATIKDIAIKLYEGYDFKSKEILGPIKVLPKYLQEAIKKKDTSIMKQVEKLKTKPLRIAYKDIIRRLNELNDEELQKYIKTAYHEKIRYYANRIAKTETHRAMMSKRAMEYLNDKEVEFVRYEMSAAHPKMDICDFYANLDVGYGRGIIPKKEMRTLPLHPHCGCIYAPYYGKVKGKRKSWRDAVNETMSKFNEAEQKEILGTYDMLNRFKAGEDIEKIFNTIRPKYPIRRYVELFDKMEYNNSIKSYEDKILKKFENFDTSSKEKVIESFKGLFLNEKHYKKHLEKRLRMEHIKDDFDYVLKTIECLSNSKQYVIAKYEDSEIWDRIRYFDNDEWIVIFAENGILLTSHKKEKDEIDFIKKHKLLGATIKKGEVNAKFRDYFKTLRNKFRIF